MRGVKYLTDVVALLHKSSLGRVTPNPGRGYATAAV